MAPRLLLARRLGRQVVPAGSAGEDYWPGKWSADRYRHLNELVLRWLGKHLAGQTEPRPLSKRYTPGSQPAVHRRSADIGL